MKVLVGTSIQYRHEDTAIDPADVNIHVIVIDFQRVLEEDECNEQEPWKDIKALPNSEFFNV